MIKNKFNLLRPVLAILIIFLPLYPKFPLANFTGTYVALRLDDVIVALAVFFWVVAALKDRLKIVSEPVSRLFLAYFLAIIISLINALLIHQTDRSSLLFLHTLRRFEYMSLFFVTIATLKTSPILRPFLLFFYLTLIGVIAYGYGQKYLGLPVISTMNSEFSKGQLLQMDNWTRISSTFAGHYDLAAFLSVGLIIIGGIGLVTTKKYLALISLGLWLFSFHILTLTASRVSSFAFYGGMCLAIVLLRKYLWIVPLTLVFIFSLVNSKDLNQRLLATIPALQKQLAFLRVTPTTIPQPTRPPATLTPVPAKTTPIIAVKLTPVPTVVRHGPIDEYIPVDTDVGVARSGEIRFNAEWPRAITAFRKNILFGTGLGSITLATDNDYLRLLGESGLLGAITFLAIFVYFAYQTFLHPTPITLIFFSAMVTFLLNASLIDVFEASKTAYLFWIMMGFYYQSLPKRQS